MDGDPRLPIYLRLRDELAGKIAAQEWRAGEAIPSESDLAGRYGVAVGTLRKTLDLLVAEGLLERAQGKGTFVRRPRFDSSLFRFFRFQNQAGERRIPQGRVLGAMFYGQDITEEDLMKKQLIQSEKMATLGTMLAGQTADA